MYPYWNHLATTRRLLVQDIYYVLLRRRKGILLCCCRSVGRSTNNFRSFSRSRSIWVQPINLWQIYTPWTSKKSNNSSFRSFSLRGSTYWNFIHIYYNYTLAMFDFRFDRLRIYVHRTLKASNYLQLLFISSQRSSREGRGHMCFTNISWFHYCFSK